MFLKHICWSQQTVLSRNQRILSRCADFQFCILLFTVYCLLFTRICIIFVALLHFCELLTALLILILLHLVTSLVFKTIFREQDQLLVFFRRESNDERIESGKAEAPFSITGLHTTSTFSYNKASNRISSRDHMIYVRVYIYIYIYIYIYVNDTDAIHLFTSHKSILSHTVFSKGTAKRHLM